MKAYIKMENAIIKSGDIEIQKQSTYFTNIKDLFQEKINKVLVSNKVCFGKKWYKYFIGYKDTKKN